ncbi:MAG: methyl-accepting chemotaxis protein [Vicinamibacterales bacterium]
MTRGWTVGRKLFTGVGALAVLVVLGGVISIWQAVVLKDELDEIALSSARKLELAMALDEKLTSLRVDERGLLLAALASDSAVMDQAHADIDRHLAEARNALAEMTPLLVLPEGQKAADEVRRGLEEWVESKKEIDGLIANLAVSEAWTVSKTKTYPILDRINGQTNTLIELQRKLMAESVATGQSAFVMGLTTAGAVIVLSLVVVGVVVWSVFGITRALGTATVELGDGAEQVAGAARQVSTSAQSLSQGATEQAASLEETSASMEEMASMTRQNAENSQRAAELMQAVDGRVQESNRALDEMVTSMAAIKESSDKISRIIKTIDEIAFQTNILALNAAVEAARAGEAGMGFAVVADEVRSLAQRSAQAARDTAGLIEESIDKSSTGGVKVQEVASSIRGITEAIAEVKGLVDEVSVASRQQTQGIDQVTQAISQMEKVTQGTAATAEESAAASEELSAQSDHTMAVVHRLQAMVGSSQAPAGAVPVPVAGRAASAPAHVVKMTPRARPAGAQTPEDVIPMDDVGTGTFGSF